MRSAIYYPDIDIRSEDTLRAALLMWDELKVIVPYQDFHIAPKPKPLAAAWELVGSAICPDDEQKRRAHENISELLNSDVAVDVLYRDDLPPEEVYKIYPEKLFPETWTLLEERRVAGHRLANGDYPFREQVGLAIMAKLADACAGTTFARWTETFLAYGLVADRDPATAAQTSVVPLTLELIDTTRISTDRLIEFRKRELSEVRGNDYRKMRYKYADLVIEHINATAAVKSENELVELRRQFRVQMDTDLKDLRDALGLNLAQTITSSVVVSSVVAAGSWLALANPLTGITAMTVGSGAAKVIEKVFQLFGLQRGFSAKQRQIMTEHPMAYVYALSRVR
jgi:hypothetical protein